MVLWKKAILLLVMTVVSSILHNLIYGLTGIEEPVFFLLTLIFLFGFVVLVIYMIIKYLKKKL